MTDQRMKVWEGGQVYVDIGSIGFFEWSMIGSRDRTVSFYHSISFR